MSITQNIPIIRAATAKNMLEATQAYAELGLSILPLQGKRPSIRSWKEYQSRRASKAEIDGWHTRNLLENVGIVCGAVSGNLVVLDLDGAAGYPAFVATFPHLAQTYTVATGGGVNKHVYFRVKQLPESIKAMNTPIGHLELCGEGRQVVAPPSFHPITGKAYQVETDIWQVENLAKLSDWITSFKVPAREKTWQPPQHLPAGDATINPQLIDAIAGILCTVRVSGNMGIGYMDAVSILNVTLMGIDIHLLASIYLVDMDTATSVARCWQKKYASRSISIRIPKVVW